MKKLDILIKARKLLSDPRRWVKGEYNVPGEYVDRPDVDGGFCYCAIGAVQAAAGITQDDIEQHANWEVAYDGPKPENWVTIPEAYIEAVTFLRQFTPVIKNPFTDDVYHDEVESYNDNEATTYEDVLKLFSDAIQAEVARGIDTIIAPEEVAA